MLAIMVIYAVIGLALTCFLLTVADGLQGYLMAIAGGLLWPLTLLFAAYTAWKLKGGQR